jgi:hypothetical protein
MSRIAYEVSRRMTPEYAKERARDMAREGMYRARVRAVESSWFTPVLGAAVGALVAKALQSRAQEQGWGARSPQPRFERRRYAYPYPRGSYSVEEYDEYGTAVPSADDEQLAGSEERSGLGEKAAQRAADVKERARETTEQVKERARETTEQVKDRARETTEQVKDRARATAGQVKERFQEATSSLRERFPDRERLRASTHEDTGLWALGAMALGALFGFALPETQREREMLDPARRKARELGQQARDMALEKGSQALDKATEKVGSIGAEQRQGQPGASTGAEPPTALH